MSRPFLVSIDLNKNEIQNAVAQVLATAPAAPVPGQFYYNSASARFEFRGASAWIDPTARANHTGTQLASTISNFDTQVRTNSLDQLLPAAASINANSQRIISVATPTADTDAANKGYVDAAVNGLDWKNSTRVGTTADLPALSGLLTIDGVTLVAGDRVFVKNQTTASANGIYVAASGAWARAVDADANVEVTAGMAAMITEGTTQADTQWRLLTNDPIVVGTTALSFAQIGATTSYTPGAGVTIVGNTIGIDTAVVVRKFAGPVGDGAATSIAVTHNLGTLDVQVQLYVIATGDTVECDVRRTSVNQVTLGFASAPANASLRAVVQG